MSLVARPVGCDSETSGQYEVATCLAWKIHDARYCVEVERTVEVGKQLVLTVGARLVHHLGAKLRSIDDKDSEVRPTRVQQVRGSQDLRSFREMDEPINSERIGDVAPAGLSLGPVGFANDVKEDRLHRPDCSSR